MAGLGEASAVTGLIGLAGQTIQSASFLYRFFKSYQSIHPQIAGIGIELDSLLSCLGQIQDAVSHATTVSVTSTNAQAELENSLRRCYATVSEIGQQLDPVKTVKRSVIKKLKIAARDNYFPQLQHQLSIHREELAVLIGTLAWLVKHMHPVA